MTPPEKVKRDQRLRLRILEALQSSQSSPMGGMYARSLVDLIDAYSPPRQGFENDPHATQLVQELTVKGYLDKSEKPKNHPTANQSSGLDYWFLKLSAKGIDYLAGSLPIDPMITAVIEAEGT